MTKEPTCVETGTKERACICGEKETEVVPSTGHDIVDGICTKCGYMPATENLHFVLINDEYYEVYCVSCQEKVINIPGEHDGKPVRVVMDFGDRDFIEVINIAEGITTIGKNAFKGLPNLRKINLPNSLTTIGENAFTGSGIREIIIPDGVISIGEYAFSECKNLTEITIPSGVESIGMFEFAESGLVRFVDQGGFSVLDGYTFRCCKQLKEVILSENIKEIRYGAFWECESLESIVIPDGVTAIRSGVFFGCKSLETLTIPGTIEEMDAELFGKSGLKTLIINEGVKAFIHSFLDGCESLETIELPSSIINLDMYMFRDCTALKDIYINVNKEQWKDINVSKMEDKEIYQFVIHCTDGDLERTEYLFSIEE